MSRNTGWLTLVIIVLCACGDEGFIEPQMQMYGFRDSGQTSPQPDIAIPVTDAMILAGDGGLPMPDALVGAGDAQPTPDGVVVPIDAEVSADAEVMPDAAAPDVTGVQIGSAGNSLLGMPFYGLYDFSQMGAIHLAEELIEQGAQSGDIRSIQFQFTGWGQGYAVVGQPLRYPT